jgi:hypothetical protein
VLGPEGPSSPLRPQMTEMEQKAWQRSLDVIAAANESLPI